MNAQHFGRAGATPLYTLYITARLLVAVRELSKELCMLLYIIMESEDACAVMMSKVTITAFSPISISTRRYRRRRRTMAGDGIVINLMQDQLR